MKTIFRENFIYQRWFFITFTNEGLQSDMTFYTKTKMTFPSPVQNISSALTPLTSRPPSLWHTLSLPSHRPAESLLGFGRKPTLGRHGFEKSGRIWDTAETHARPNLRSDRISCRDTHAGHIWPAARDLAFSNPDLADRPFPNPYPAGNSPLSPSFP
jgi:hypothetical protein